LFHQSDVLKKVKGERMKMKNRALHILFLICFCAVACFLTVTEGLFALENGLARTPPMGWNSWNIFGGSIDEARIREIADAMVSSGMRDAGYIYLNLDDNWMKSGRDSSGNLVGDPTRFPGGIRALADYVHSKGLKLGIYGCRGTATCMNIPESGSQGNEVRDANTWASWGIDYLKYDSCNAQLDLRTQYEAMRDALAGCGRPIVYSICCWYFVDTWMIDAGNLWRTTSDIQDNWGSFMSITDINEKLYMHAGPGHWNDPDMLEVGNGNCTYEEYRSHFSLWCIMAAPLIAGNDIRTMSSQTRDILCNTEAIAVNQDSAGIQGRIVKDNGDLEVWLKALGSANGSEKAVLLLNRGGGTSSITVNWSDIGLSGSANVRDLWEKRDLGSYNGSYSASVPSHGSVFLRIGGSGSTTTTPPTAGPTDPGGTPGDVNENGSIDIVDALLVAQYYVGLNPSGFVYANADVTRDGTVNIVDALRIAQCYVGLVSCQF
jgi:alpha-galactosidase